jgi:phospholipase C
MIRLPRTLPLILLALSSAAAFAQTVTFKHVIVVFQENRTPDNLFGSNPNFEPGVDIATFGINSKGKKIPLTATPLNNCYDLSHAHRAFTLEYDHGKMDGADLVSVGKDPRCVVPENPQYKFVDNSDGTVQPYFDIAKQYGFANRMFQTNQGPSFPAHQFIISGTSAPDTNSPLFAAENMGLKESAGCLAPANQTVKVIDQKGSETSNPPIYPCFEHPTLTDELNKAGITWKYYTPTAGSIWTGPNAIRHMCLPKDENGKLVCTGDDWVSHVVIPPNKFLSDIQNCQLPAVSWVIPNAPQSDHARSADGSGPAWVAAIVNALGANRRCGKTGEVYWKDTAIFITWDDWGGWYDHVPPYRVGQRKGWGSGYVYGFRVPLLVVSAYTPAGYVNNANHDFGSILKFIEKNFSAQGQPLGLIGPGTYADAYANNLEFFFSLTRARPFHPIAAKFDVNHFLHSHETLAGPDND